MNMHELFLIFWNSSDFSELSRVGFSLFPVGSYVVDRKSIILFIRSSADSFQVDLYCKHGEVLLMKTFYFWCVQAVLNATRTQLEREMMLEDVHHVEDLPAFNLLCPSQD
jgi:hypothetical protein